MHAERPLATSEYLRQQVDDHRQPLTLVCADLGISAWIGARLLEVGRRERKAREALKQKGGQHG